MKQWHRHLVLCERARREGRRGHRHAWWKRGDFMGSVWSCWCGKQITEKQLVAAGSVEDAARLFFPLVKEQVDSIFDTSFFALRLN